MNWKSKAAIQKAISFLPGKTSLNRQMQRVTGGLKLSDQQFEWKIGHARDHYQYYTDYCQKPFSDTRVLELGTGWYPIIPIYFFLKGCRSFDSIDIYQWLKVENYYSVIAMYRAWRDDGRLDAFIDDIDESNWDILMRILAGDLGVEEINERIFFNPMLGDASTTSKISSGYDLICSNNVLEHIYPKSLEPILARFHGLVNEGGVMSHFIDLSDHFALHVQKAQLAAQSCLYIQEVICRVGVDHCRNSAMAIVRCIADVRLSTHTIVALGQTAGEVGIGRYPIQPVTRKGHKLVVATWEPRACEVHRDGGALAQWRLCPRQSISQAISHTITDERGACRQRGRCEASIIDGWSTLSKGPTIRNSRIVKSGRCDRIR